MSNNADDQQIKDRLEQLRCHFTWKLLFEDSEMPDLENRILDEMEFLDTKYNVGIHNILAYVKHLNGQNEEALECLKNAEDLIQKEQTDYLDMRSLVTWGNYAWVYYHMGRLAEAQTYLDKVENACKKFANLFCYTDCPWMDCEEGWALMKCGRKNYLRAKACFEKALEMDPDNPEFSVGYAIIIYRLDCLNRIIQNSDYAQSLHPLRQAIRLNPEDSYLKVLLALKLQDLGEEDEGEKYIDEALSSQFSQTYVFRYAAKFYRKRGNLEKALQLLKQAVRNTPVSAFLHHQIGLCYRAQALQIKSAAKMQPRGQDRENVNRLLKSAIFHFKFAVDQKPTFEIAYLHLASMYGEAGNHQEAEDIFQKMLHMTPREEETLQELYLFYGRFQEFQKKSEATAIAYYLKAIKLEQPSFTRDKVITSLERLALKKFRRNPSDLETLSLLGFAYKLKGELKEALEYYERALRLAADLENSTEHGP